MVLYLGESTFDTLELTIFCTVNRQRQIDISKFSFQEKRFDFIKNKEKIVEKIRIEDLEAKFIVENTGMNFILNYDVNIVSIIEQININS